MSLNARRPSRRRSESRVEVTWKTAEFLAPPPHQPRRARIADFI